MLRIHKILFSLSFILIAVTILGLFRQNLISLPYMSAVSAISKPTTLSASETCQQSWLRVAASSANPSYFIQPGDVSVLLDCGLEYASLLSAIQPHNYEYAFIAAARYPDDPDIWLWLGDASGSTVPQTAILAYSHVVQLQPANGLAWCLLAKRYENAKQPQAALNAYIPCCHNGDPGSYGCYGAGRLLEKLGTPQQAIAYYRLSQWDKSLKRADVLQAQLNAGK